MMEQQEAVQVRVSYGVLADDIETQLNEQGFTLGDNAERYEENKKRIHYLVFADILTDSVARKAFEKLHKQVIKKIKQQEEK